MKEDVLLFADAEPTHLGDGIVGCSSLNYLPFDVVGDVVPYERPNILTESSACVVLIPCVYVRHVLIVPGLHRFVGATSVGLPVVSVSPGDSGFVLQVFHYAAFAREDLAGVRCLVR